MRDSLLEHLACPACGCSDLKLEVREKTDRDEVESGGIHCRGCRVAYPIVRGIPRMLPESSWYFGGSASGDQADGRAKAMRLTVEHYSSYQGKVSAPFADTMDHRAILEARTGLEMSFFSGRVCLDAGCGNGRNTRVLGEAGAAIAIGLDAGFAVDEARRRSRNLENVHFVQGDILRPPFRKQHFDRVLSMGVLHHTVEPDVAFSGLCGLLKEDASFCIYLYGRPATDWRRYGSFQSVFGELRYAFYTEPLRRLIVRLPNGVRLRFCELMWQRRRLIDWLAAKGSLGKMLSTALYYATPMDVHMPLESASANISRMYDSYSTPWAYGHEVQEALDWYEQAGGFREVFVTPYRVCLTGFRGPRAPGEPLTVRYHRAASIAALAAQGRSKLDGPSALGDPRSRTGST